LRPRDEGGGESFESTGGNLDAVPEQRSDPQGEPTS